MLIDGDLSTINGKNFLTIILEKRLIRIYGKVVMIITILSIFVVVSAMNLSLHLIYAESSPHKDSNKKWTIAIQNPFSNRGEYIGIIEVENSSIVTSGVYERFLEYKNYIDSLNSKLERQIALWCINNKDIMMKKISDISVLFHQMTLKLVPP